MFKAGLVFRELFSQLEAAGRVAELKTITTANAVKPQASFAGVTVPVSRQHNVPQNLPIAVGLALPDGEKTAAVDRQFPVFEHPDFAVSRFIGEVTVDHEFLRVDLVDCANPERANRSRYIFSISVRP